MAFGRPGKLAAFTYLVVVMAGVVLGLTGDPLWLRILGFAAAGYAAFCFIISGGWTTLPSWRVRDGKIVDESGRRGEPAKANATGDSTSPPSQSRLPT